MLVFCEECGGRIFVTKETTAEVHCPHCGYVTVRQPPDLAAGRATPTPAVDDEELWSDEGEARRGEE